MLGPDGEEEEEEGTRVYSAAETRFHNHTITFGLLSRQRRKEKRNRPDSVSSLSGFIFTLKAGELYVSVI